MTYHDPYPPFLAPTYDGLDDCADCAEHEDGICRDCLAELRDQDVPIEAEIREGK